MRNIYIKPTTESGNAQAGILPDTAIILTLCDRINDEVEIGLFKPDMY
jgi:hypothetical protein